MLKENFNKKLRVILAARFLEDKGIKEYINLASKVNSTDIKFYLAGELDEGNPKSLTYKDLENIKKSKFVEYLGFVDLKKELKNYDVLISLSNHEGFSRVLLEAIYVGLYCIAFKNSGTEFIEDFQNTKIVDSKNLEIINNEIIEILNNNQKISLKNREIINEKYSTKNIAISFDKIYKMEF
jgi:glycosyltransferase involved in cell wall biosynthesis